jgi:hypothetical protein
LAGLVLIERNLKRGPSLLSSGERIQRIDSAEAERPSLEPDVGCTGSFTFAATTA